MTNAHDMMVLLEGSMFNLVWFRSDYRVDDHPALWSAMQESYPIIAVTLFPKPTSLFGLSSPSNMRAQAQYDAIKHLHKKLAEMGIGLLVIQDINQLSQIDPTTIKKVFYHRLLGTEEAREEQQFQRYFPSATFIVKESYSLIHPDDLPFPIELTPNVFTIFRKKVENHTPIHSPLPAIKYQQKGPLYSMPDLEYFGFDEVKIIVSTDEESALKRLQYYCLETRNVLQYKQTRNGMLHWDDSSKLSMYLSIGSLSPRRVYAVLQQAEEQFGANDSTYWLWFELLWRDYFYFVHWQEKSRFFMPWNLSTTLTPSKETFYHAILKGETGYPLIDANMKELTQTGWMSNRGRQNVASFFVHYCKLPWALGAVMFESFLLDYNVSSNIGNWRYVSGVGHDPRDHRVFNVVKQGIQYDPSTEYILKWLPQLKAIPQNKRYFVHQLTPKDRSDIGYPDPIVGLPWQ